MTTRAFTLIETMVAVALLAIAIVAPMTLATRSLQTAYYARDQVIASFLGQEAVEVVRGIRDHNLMEIQHATPGITAFTGIPIGADFVIDTRSAQIWKNSDLSVSGCTAATALIKSETASAFYGYGTDPCNTNESGWTPTTFTRVVRADPINGTTDEIKVTSTVTWSSGVFGSRTAVTSENLYAWVN